MSEDATAVVFSVSNDVSGKPTWRRSANVPTSGAMAITISPQWVLRNPVEAACRFWAPPNDYLLEGIVQLRITEIDEEFTEDIPKGVWGDDDRS